MESAQVGQPADDGQFRFTANNLQCGRQQIGDPEFLGEEAQGQFCLLTVSVENVGDQPQSLFSDNQYLIDGQGRRHSADGPATMTLPRNADAWLSEINPGNTVDGVFVFDVPQNITIREAELRRLGVLSRCVG